MLFCHKPCGQVEGRCGLGRHEARGLECGRNHREIVALGTTRKGELVLEGSRSCEVEEPRCIN